jgi:carbon-monoxide dehydrogenase medium subunit
VKPSSFDYIRPRTLQEALELLADGTEETKVIAGGQSLVPMMNFRLARPSRLIDIGGLVELEGLHQEGDRVHVGARVRHLQLQNTALGGPLGSLLRRTAALVGHLPIRTRGTFGGSLAHSDAASEWCLLARLLDAEITVRSLRGERVIPAEDFFVSVFTTAMELDELLVSVSLPVLGEDHRTGIAEFARRAGDFAIVAVFGDVVASGDTVTAARVVIGGVSDKPFRSTAAEKALLGGTFTPALLERAAEAAAEDVDPPSDAHGDALYRRDLVRALLPRALRTGVEA